MTWFRVDDSFYDHPKVDDLPDAAIALWVRAGTYCARHLTDGRIPKRKARRLCDDPDVAIPALLKCGMLTDAGDDYLFHDWADYQPTREEVLAERSANAARQKAWRDRRRVERAAARDASVTGNALRDSRRDSGVTDAGSNASRNAVSNVVSNAVTNDVRNASVTASVTGAPTRPVPSRPDPTVVPTELRQAEDQTLFPLAPRDGTKPARASTAQRNADDPLFGEFYNAYPRKKEPVAARKAWDKAIRSTDPKLIIAAARRYADERQGQDPQYTAYPASWLNAGGYRSEADPPPGTDVMPYGGRHNAQPAAATLPDGRSVHRKTVAHFDHMSAYGDPDV